MQWVCWALGRGVPNLHWVAWKTSVVSEPIGATSRGRLMATVAPAIIGGAQPV